jgi:hypothetical protein
VRLDVQQDLFDVAVGEQVVDENQVRDQFPARVVRDEGDGGGAAGRQEGPQRCPVVDDQAGGGVARR